MARSTYWEARRDPDFLMVVDALRESFYPQKKIELAMRIVADALTPLAEARNPRAIITTREQAAAFLGLKIQPGGPGREIPLPDWSRS